MHSAYVQDLKHQEDELAIRYLPAVKAMAFRLKERLPSSVDYADLSAIGTEELIKLARRYDDSLNDNFWGYAKKRVYGAMLDYLRSLDVVSRANRKLIKAIDLAVEEYMLQYDTEPSDAELAQILGEDVQKIHDARVASNIYTVMPLHDQLQVGDEGAALAKVEREELVELIRRVLSSYKEREQMIIQLYYFEEMTLKEISDILHITESRISQIHKSVLQKIKGSIGA
jgi:RNA polymerase sigma factor for flagellar operon FliA